MNICAIVPPSWLYREKRKQLSSVPQQHLVLCDTLTDTSTSCLPSLLTMPCGVVAIDVVLFVLCSLFWLRAEGLRPHLVVLLLGMFALHWVLRFVYLFLCCGGTQIRSSRPESVNDGVKRKRNSQLLFVLTTHVVVIE